MPRSDLAGVTPLLQQFFDHAKRNVIPFGNLLRAIAPVVGRHNSFTQIARERSHTYSYTRTESVWLQNYLKCSS